MPGGTFEIRQDQPSRRASKDEQDKKTKSFKSLEHPDSAF